jgi:hypothetical protein
MRRISRARTAGRRLRSCVPRQVGKRMRCQQCGTRNVSARDKQYGIRSPQLRRPEKDDPICPRCGSDDVHTWPLR